MLGLRLRKEFQGRRLKGTAIELTNANKTGAVQVSAQEFLEITYPSGDLLKALESVQPQQSRPVVLIGDRGQGKSHLIAALHHALKDRGATQSWLAHWASRLGRPELAGLSLRDGMTVVTESLHQHRYKFLWELLFKNHPRGQYYQGRWSGSNKTALPPRELLLEMLQEQPTALILDEYQTWYDGQVQQDDKPHRAWAFNFIQNLSEIASEHPELLLLVVSVREGTTDAYQQIHRNNPIQVDFKGPEARRDRRRLLLHRLFDNRLQVPEESIAALMGSHINERLRLFNVAPDEHANRIGEYLEAWPFSPPLLELLEDQVLVATEAQDTRDLIRVLAGLFKSRGEQAPVLTAADFNLASENNEVAALLESVANPHHRALREKALRNMDAVRDAVSDHAKELPHLAEILSALWLRSVAVGNLAGAEPAALQLDVTRSRPVDDNLFGAELEQIVQNSFNIHRDGSRLVFREEENPQARLLAEARNDRLFADGSDSLELAKNVRYVLSGGDEAARDFVVVVLGPQWQDQPWSGPGSLVKPETWGDRLPLVVLPEAPDDAGRQLGRWLRSHLQTGRNTVRFLFPSASRLYHDRDLRVCVRAAWKAEEWKSHNPAYGPLQKKYRNDLHNSLKERFDRIAVLESWSFQEPERSRFRIERVQAQGSKIPAAVDQAVREDIYEPEAFADFVQQLADQHQSVARLLAELKEPRPNGEACIPWLGETIMKERLLRLCAQGKISISVRGLENLQRRAGETPAEAWERMKARLGTGRHLEDTLLLPPQAQGGSASVGNSAEKVPPPPDRPGGAAAGHEESAPISGPGNLFGGQATATGLRPLQAHATSKLNLLGKLEAWGLGPAARLRQVSVRVETATGSQLHEVLRSLPDGMRYELSLEVEEGA